MREPTHRDPPTLERPSEGPIHGEPVLWLAASQRRRMQRWSLAVAPREACGLLIGVRTPEGTRVHELTLGTNLSPADAPDRFELDPIQLVQAEDAARARGLQVVGLWHSHPGAHALPSPLDRRDAVRGWSYPILSLLGGQPGQLRSWRLGAHLVQEERVLA